MRALVLATTLLLSLSVSAQAQTKGNQLRGVSQFKIVIDPLDSHSAQCGLTEEGIRRAILYPASSAEFKISDDAALTWLQVNVATMFSGSLDFCATHILLHAVSFQKVMLQASGREVFSRIELWSDGRMGVGQRREHQRGVEQAIEDSTKQFVTD